MQIADYKLKAVGGTESRRNATIRRWLLGVLAVFVATLVCGGAGLAAPAEDVEEAPVEEPAGDDEPPLPLIDKMELPSFQQLMKGPAVDWIVMHSKKVLIVEPVYPRPGALDEIDQKTRKLMRKTGDPPESETAKRKRLAAYYLPITLLEGEGGVGKTLSLKARIVTRSVGRSSLRKRFTDSFFWFGMRRW